MSIEELGGVQIGVQGRNVAYHATGAWCNKNEHWGKAKAFDAGHIHLLQVKHRPSR